MSPANHVTLKMRRGLRFIVLIREDLNVQPVADILQRQHILLSYFNTLSVNPVWNSNPRPLAQHTGALPTELTRRWLVAFRLCGLPVKNFVSVKLTESFSPLENSRPFNIPILC